MLSCADRTGDLYGLRLKFKAYTFSTFLILYEHNRKHPFIHRYIALNPLQKRSLYLRAVWGKVVGLKVALPRLPGVPPKRGSASRGRGSMAEGGRGHVWFKGVSGLDWRIV